MPEETRKGPGMEVKCNRAYVNSKVFGSDNPKAPLNVYVKWTIASKDRNSEKPRDYNTIKIVFFAREDRDNHPLKTAQKGDIITFPSGILQFKTKPEGEGQSKKEVIEYAEVVVFNDLNVEKTSGYSNSNYNNQNSAPSNQQSNTPPANTPPASESTGNSIPLDDDDAPPL